MSEFRRSFIRLTSALLLAVLPLVVSAQVADPVYTAEVRVKSQSPQDTLNGTARALLQVLERVSGDPGVKSRPYLGHELKNSRSLVKSHDFVQKEGLNAAGIPSFGTNMIVQFHPDRVRALAKRVGLQIWPEPRQKPLTWLVVDDGKRGPRLVSYRERAAAQSLLDRGRYRGIQMVLPHGNAAEKLLAGAVLRKDYRALSVASAAYAGDTQLVGYMRRKGDGWVSDWAFFDRGKKLREWTTEDKDAFVTMAGGANGAADSLIRRYAIAGRPPQPPPLTLEELAELEAKKAAAAAASTEPSGDDPNLAGRPGVNTMSVVRESFSGIHNNADYSNLIGKLNQIPGVRSVTTVATTPGGVSVDISYQGDPSALQAAIALQGLRSGGSKVLERPTPPPATPAPTTTEPKPATPPANPNAKTPPADTKPTTEPGTF